jgi:hypothetical protein
MDRLEKLCDCSRASALIKKNAASNRSTYEKWRWKMAASTGNQNFGTVEKPPNLADEFVVDLHYFCKDFWECNVYAALAQVGETAILTDIRHYTTPLRNQPVSKAPALT